MPLSYIAFGRIVPNRRKGSRLLKMLVHYNANYNLYFIPRCSACSTCWRTWLDPSTSTGTGKTLTPIPPSQDQC